MTVETADIPFTILPTGEQIYTNALTPISAVPKKSTNLTGFGDFESLSGEYSPNAFIWDFGDGTTSRSLTAEHIYNWPGEYNVTLTVINSAGEPVVSKQTETIVAIDFIPTQIEFIDTREIYNIPSGQKSDPITIGILSSWQNYLPPSRRNDDCDDGEEHWMTATKTIPGHWMCGSTHDSSKSLNPEPIFTLNMYTSGSLSTPLDPVKYYKNKTSHLNQTWSFYNTVSTIADIPTTFVDITLVDSVTGTSGDPNTYDKLYYRHSPEGDGFERVFEDTTGAVLVGLSGNGQFTYRDDTVKNTDSIIHPVIMSVELDTKNIFDETIFNNFYSQPVELGYLNSEIKTISNIKTRNNIATKLAITSTGSNDIPLNEIKWEDTTIPFTVTFQDDDGNNILDYPSMETVEVDLVVTGTPVDANIVFGVDEVIDNTNTSYYKGYFKYSDTITTEKAKLQASIDITQPSGYTCDAILGWLFATDSGDTEYGTIVRYHISDNFEFDNGLQHELRGNSFDVSLTGVISTITVVTPGSDMAQPPGIIVTGAGTGAVLEVVFDEDTGTVTDILVIDGGTGYTDSTVISFIVDEASVAPTVAFTLNNNTDILPITVAVSGDDDGSMFSWVAEQGDDDRILKISTCGSILSSLSIYDIVGTDSIHGDTIYQPSCIALDKNCNPWVTLENSLWTIQLDKDTGEKLQTIIPQSPLVPDVTWKPVVVDTDADNNVYVGYNQSGSAILVKYDESGTQLDSMTETSTLIDMLVLRTGTVVWLTDTRLGLLDTDTLEGGTNIYTVKDSDTLVRYSGSDYSTKHTLQFSGANISTIAGDSRGYIWVVDNINRKTYYVKGSVNDIGILVEYTQQAVLPTGDTAYGYDSHTQGDAINAFGDWTGFRWLHKFGYIPAEVKTITGESAEFYIYPKEGQYNIRKQKEDHDQTSITRSYAMQPWLQSNHNLWDNFIGTIVGSISSDPNTLGKYIHEKVGNFTANNNDIDDCNIDALYSLCDMYDIEIEKYNLAYPPSLKRLLDLMSIKHKRLIGETVPVDDVFDMYDDITNANTRVNLGEEIDAVSYMLTPGTPIIAYESFSRNFSKIAVGPALIGEFNTAGHIINTKEDPAYSPSLQYPLSEYSQFWRWPLVVPKGQDNAITGIDVLKYYRFFTYNASTSANTVENIINWDDDQTTLTNTLSTMSEWTDDNGIADNILEHQLRVGLDLFDD